MQKILFSIIAALIFTLSIFAIPVAHASSTNGTHISPSRSAIHAAIPPPSLPLKNSIGQPHEQLPVPKIPKGMPQGTPLIGPNGKPLSVQPLLSQNHWWDITYFSQSPSNNDYHGEFVAQDNNIQGLTATCGVGKGSCRDTILFLPLNVALGTSSSLVWFQFSIQFDKICTLGLCNQSVYWDLQNNIDTTGQCSGTSVTGNINQIGLSYNPGDKYHWDLYPDTSKTNYMIFMIVDDTLGGINSGAYWWNEWQVPSLNQLYNPGTCFSPASAVEGYTDSGTTALSSIPSFSFNEGDGIGPNAEYRTGIGQPSGISDSMVQIGSTGNWWWRTYQDGTFTPVSILLGQDAHSASLSPSNDFTLYYSELGTTYSTSYVSSIPFIGDSLTIPVDQNSFLGISGVSSASNTSEEWCLDRLCVNRSFLIPSTTSLYFTVYDMLAQPTSISVAYGGSPPEIDLTYLTAAGASGGPDGQVTLPLSTSAQTAWATRGSIATVPSCTPTTLGKIRYCLSEDWATPTSSWTITGANIISNPIVYDHQYHLDMAISPTGAGTSTPGPSYVNAGTSIPITATPALCKTFANWSSSTPGISIDSPTSATTSVTIGAIGTITANFINATCTSFPIIQMNDITASFDSLISSSRPFIGEYVSPTSTLVGKPIDSISLRMAKVGAPTGTAQVGIFDINRNVVKLFANVDVSTISNTDTVYEFKLPATDLYTIQSGDRIGIKYAGGSSTVGVNVTPDRVAGDPFDGTNSYRIRYETAWITSSTEDMYMILKQTHGVTGPPLPGMTLTPTSGPNGTTVSVTGTSFPASSPVTMTYDSTNLVTTPSPITTNTIGGFSVTFIVPSSTAAGHTVMASSGRSSGQATFTVTTPVINPAAPASGPVGQSVSVNFNHLIASHSYTIKFGGTTANGAFATGTTNSTGGASGSVTVPSITTGSQPLSVTDGTNTPSTPFTVTSSTLHPTTTSITPNPSQVAPSSTIPYTATVTDNSGTPTAPTGSVTFSDGGKGGSFTACTLVAGTGKSTCSTTYTSPSAAGPETINGTYPGDSTHQKSSGISALTVGTSTFPIIVMSDTTVSFDSLISSSRPFIGEYASPTSALVGKQIDSITLRMAKVGAPTGTAQVGIFDINRNIVKLFATVDVSTISTTDTVYEFKLAPTDHYIIKSGDRIGFAYTGGSSTVGVNVTPDRVTTDPFDGANSYRVRYETAWITSSSEDMYMILKQTHG